MAGYPSVSACADLQQRSIQARCPGWATPSLVALPQAADVRW